MNLIIDINPYLIRKYQIEKFILDSNIEAEDNIVDINPDGIIASRIFDTFNVNNRIFTFLGGLNGEKYKRILSLENPDLVIYKVRDETSEKIVVEDGNRTFNIISKQPRITNEEFRGIYSNVLNQLENSEFMILTGGREVEYEENIRLNILNMASKAGVKSGISSNGENLKEIIETKPYIIVVDKKALENYSQMEITFNWELNKIANSILENGVEKVLYFKEDGNLKLFTKESIYETESENFVFDESLKDRILAGYGAARARGYDEEMRLSIALAASEVPLDRATMKRDASEIKNRMKDIRVERFNAR